MTLLSSTRPDSPGMRMSDTSTCGWLTPKRLQHFVRGGERLERNSFARERLLEDPADRPVVVDDPDVLHVRRRAAHRSRRRTSAWLFPRSSDASCRVPRHFQRKQDREDRASRRAFPFDRAVVLGDERLRDRQPETGAALAAGDQRIEDPVADRPAESRGRCPRPTARAPADSAVFASVTPRATRVVRRISGLPSSPRTSACAALRAMLRTTCVSCSGSASNSGRLMSKSARSRRSRETRPARRCARARGFRGCWCGDRQAGGAASAGG